MMKVALASVARLFATPLVPADYLGLVAPLAIPHRARVEAVRDEAPGVRTLVLRPGRGWRPHVAGQHVRVGITLDGRVHTRTFSIASAPGGRLIEVTVKAQGRVSRALVETVAVGTIVALGSPEGDFVLGDAARPLLFVTGGSGITPVMSMLRSFAAMPDVVHLHFARERVIFGAELRALAAAHPAYELVIIDTATDPRRLTMARLAALVPDVAAREVFACGPQALVDALEMPVHREHFGAVRAPVADATSGLVSFGKTVARSDGRTPLLELAEAAGLTPPHGCRMGICHTCDTTLTSGCVRDLRTNTCITEPGTRIQLCVCAASGDVTLSLQEHA